MRIFYLFLFIFCFSINDLSAQKKLEYEGGIDRFEITTQMKGNIPGSRVIFESEIKLSYNTNMGAILSEDIGSSIENGLFVDTVYFFLLPNDNKRRITVSAEGYSSALISLTLGAKETYKYMVFDPLVRNTYKGNYEKGMEYLSKGLYDDAGKSFEQAAKCPDIPQNNDIQSKIITSKQCKTFSEQLNFFISNKDWDNAKTACMYLLQNSPDNSVYKDQLKFINDNSHLVVKKSMKNVYFGSLTKSADNVNTEFRDKLRTYTINGITKTKRVVLKDVFADNNKAASLIQSANTHVNPDILAALKSLDCDYYIYGQLSKVKVEKVPVLDIFKKGVVEQVDKVFVTYSLEMVDTDGNAVFSQDITVSTKGTDIGAAIGELSGDVEREMKILIENNFKIEGIIIQIAEEKKGKATEVFINVGSNAGLLVGQRFDVFQVSNVAGRQLKTKIGDLKTLQVEGDIARCKVTNGGDKIKSGLDGEIILLIESRLDGLFEF